MGDHDPFNEPETAHPRARELMPEDFLWDCVDEESPFGSDEGHDAYYEFRDWRRGNPDKPLVECLSWILCDRLDEYNEALCADEQVERDLAEPEDAFLGEHFDLFTLDATVIATALGQVLDEGRIDADAKPYIRVAIKRQLHPSILTSQKRQQILRAVERVVDRA
jgi:uncharacterized protein YfeS